MHVHNRPLDVLTCKGFLPTIRTLCPRVGCFAFSLHLAHRPHTALPGRISLLLPCCPWTSLIPWHLGRHVLWSESTSIYSIGAFRPLNGRRLVDGGSPRIEVPPVGFVSGDLKDPCSGKGSTTVTNSMEEICIVAFALRSRRHSRPRTSTSKASIPQCTERAERFLDTSRNCIENG